MFEHGDDRAYNGKMLPFQAAPKAGHSFVATSVVTNTDKSVKSHHGRSVLKEVRIPVLFWHAGADANLKKSHMLQVD